MSIEGFNQTRDKRMSNRDDLLDLNLEEISLYFQRIITEHKFDYIIPTERKGIRLLEYILQNRKNSDTKIIFFDALKYDKELLNEKNILIFDDSILTGTQITDLEQEIKKLYPTIKTILKATLISLDKKALYNFYRKKGINGSSMEKIYRRYKDVLTRFECKSLEQYERYKSKLLNLILSHKMPLDTDHTIATFEIVDDIDIFKEKFVKLISNYGIIHEYDYAKKYGYLSITLDYPNFYKIKSLENFPDIIDEGIKKIRVYINKLTKVISIVPIVYPGIISDSDKNNKCTIRELFQDMLLHNCINENSNRKDCFECLSFIYSNLILFKFLDILFRNKLKLNFISVNSNDLFSRYLEKGFEIASQLQNIIKEIIDNGVPKIYSVIDSGKLPKEFKTKENLKNLFTKETIRFEVNKTLRMTTAISIIDNNLNKNFKGKRYKRKGISYSQLCDILSDQISPEQISSSLDIALDEGLLKPNIQEINLIIDNKEKKCWCRTYNTSGEIIGLLLRKYYNFIYL